MAETRSTIFNQQARERLNTPDDLDRYVRVTKPRVWVALLAVISLTVGLLAWGIFGSVSSSVSVTGTCLDGKVFCLIDTEQIIGIEVGDTAFVEGQQVRVASVSNVPVSRDEAYDLLGSDYLVDALMPGAWAYVVTLEGMDAKEDGMPTAVVINTERVAPISLVMG